MMGVNRAVTPPSDTVLQRYCDPVHIPETERTRLIDRHGTDDVYEIAVRSSETQVYVCSGCWNASICAAKRKRYFARTELTARVHLWAASGAAAARSGRLRRKDRWILHGLQIRFFFMF
jgi:hypothetical protein